MKVAVIVILLIAAGLSLGGWPGSVRQKSVVRSSEGTIERRFSKSSSYDTKVFEVKYPGLYQFDLNWQMEEGYITVTLWHQNRIQGSWSGRRINEAVVLDLDEGEYTIAIAAEAAEKGNFRVSYQAL